MCEAINAALGLDGMRVLSCSFHDGVAHLVIESTTAALRCRCGEVTDRIKDRPVVLIRDLTISDKAPVLQWRKKRWLCQACGKTTTESHAEIPPRSRLTNRLRARLGYEADQRGNFSSVANDYAVSFSTVARAHHDLATIVAEAATGQAPTVMTLDETRFRAGHDYVTIVSDVERSRPVDVIEGRHDSDLRRWFMSRDPSWLLAIRVVVCDLWPPFLRAVARWLPHATVVADRFHIMSSFTIGLDKLRKRIQGRARSRGPKSHIYAVRGALLADPRSLDYDQALKLNAALTSEPELAVGYGLVRLLRAVYDCRDRASAQRALQLLIDTAEACDVPEFRSALAGIVGHRHEILNYFDHFVTGALAEGTNTRVKLIRRQAFGMRNFDNFRERIMVACGRPKPGKPRLIA